jgi:hypothetical protein
MAVYRRHSSGMWSPYATELARSRRYGNGEIEFYRSIKEHFGARLRDHLDKTQKFLFRRLATAFFDDSDVESLHKLITENRDIAEKQLMELGFDAETVDQPDVAALRKSLLAQSRISVIVTSYNHQDYIARCLDSILAQTGLIDLQIIIGDDRSSDRTAEIIDGYAERHPDKIVVLRREKNVGMLQNMKDCLAKVDGRYVAFCEGDDYWLSPRKLMKQLSAVRPDPDVKLCFNWLLLELSDTDSFVPHAEQGELPNGEISFYSLARRPLTANFSCCFYRAEAIASVPDSYFSGKSSADWLFNLYVTNSGKAIFLKELLSVYRIQSRGQWSGLSQSVKKAQTALFKQEFSQIFGRGRGFEDIKVRVSSISVAKSFPANIIGAVLDFPRENDWMELVDGVLAFRGWVLSDYETVIIATVNDTVREVPLNIPRPDVIKALLGDHRSDAWERECGFGFDVPFCEGLKLRLDFKVDGNLAPWMVLDFEQSLLTE